MLDERELLVALAGRRSHAHIFRGHASSCIDLELTLARPRSSADRATASGAVDRRSIRLGGTATGWESPVQRRGNGTVGACVHPAIKTEVSAWASSSS